MKNKRQALLIIEIINNYRSGLISLTNTIDKIRSLIDIIDDKKFSDLIDQFMCHLYQMDGARASDNVRYVDEGVIIIESSLDGVIYETKKNFLNDQLEGDKY